MDIPQRCPVGFLVPVRAQEILANGGTGRDFLDSECIAKLEEVRVPVGTLKYIYPTGL